MNIHKVYRLFASCVLVKGFHRSVIVDINRHQLFYIPNFLYKMMKRKNTKTLCEICQKYEKSNQKIISECFDYLFRNELVFPLNKEEIERFPSLSLQWDFPSLCSNAIIDVDENSPFDINNTIRLLDEISCFHLQIRFLRSTSLE